jgi:4-amino-4-deoxy-L-arabinose transferase-like glycosyltransferase
VLTAERARLPWDEAVRSMAEPRNQGPAYYLLLRIAPGEDVVDLRIPSVVLGIVAVAFLMWLVATLFRDRGLALWSGALLAVSPLHVLLSRLARPYALLVVLSLAAIAVFVALLEGRGGRARWTTLTVVSAVAYMTHFTALVLGVGQAIAMLARRSPAALWRRWALSQALALLPLVLWVVYALGQDREPSEGSIPGPTLATIPRAVWNLLVGAGIDTGAWTLPGALVATAGLVLGAVWVARSGGDPGWTLLGIALAASVPTFVAVLTVTTKYSDRYLAVALPAFLVLTALGWRRLVPARIGVIALCVVLVTAAVVSARSTFDGREPGEDWSGAAALLVREAGPGDLVVFQRSTTRRAFEDALPEGANPGFTVLELDSVTDTAAAEDRADDVWVVYRNPIEDFHTGAYRDFEPLEPGLSEMSDWLVARRERIVEERVLEGMHVLRLSPEDSTG